MSRPRFPLSRGRCLVNGEVKQVAQILVSIFLANHVEGECPPAMDAFVIRTPRTPSRSATLPISKCNSISSVESEDGDECKIVYRGHRRGGQKRLSDLKGVVVLEDLEKFVKLLKSKSVSEQDNEEKVRVLKQLESKQPSTEVIVKSGIGKVVKTLSKSKGADSRVVKHAKIVTKSWTKLLERRVELSLSENKPEVQTDLETRTTRENARRHMRKAYPDHIEAVERLEKKLFDHFRPIIGVDYRRCVRKITISKSKFGDHITDSEYIFKKLSLL